LNTGATLQALTQYGQGLASTSYQQAYNNSLNSFQTNHNNTLGGLLALTGVGQNANSQYNQASQNYGGNTLTDAIQQGIFGQRGAQIAGDFAVGAGNAQAQGTLGAGQAWTNTLGSLTNIASGLPGVMNQNASKAATPSFNPGSGPGYGYGPTLAQLGAVG